MGTETKIVSLACPICGNEMIQNGKIRKVCDICGAVRGQALPDYSLFDPEPIPKEVLDKAFPPIDTSEVGELPEEITLFSNGIAEYVTHVTETEDKFIFDHVSRYINEELFTPEYQTIIPKRLLERALICFKEEHKEEWNVLMGIKEDK
jgi:hypothetical protein